MDKTNYAFKTLYQRKVLSDLGSKEGSKISTEQVPTDRYVAHKKKIHELDSPQKR